MMLRSLYRGCRSAWLAVVSRWNPPVVIMVYHRGATLASDPQLLAVTPENFRVQLKLWKDNYPILRLEDDWPGVKEPSVAITFDDGYADNALQALPILEEVGVPATFFICSGHVENQELFWWDELERIVLGDWAFPASGRLAGKGGIDIFVSLWDQTRL